MANVKIKVELAGVKKKLSTQNFERGRLAFANQALLDMDQFVPYRGSGLRTSGHVTAGGKTIEYVTPYARTQYYGRGFRKGVSYTISKYHTAGTGSHWDLKAKAKYGNRWAKKFVEGAGLK